MKKDHTECEWIKKIHEAVKVKSNVICVFHDQKSTHFLVLSSANMDDTTKHYVENLETQMDKVIRISNSLNKKMATAEEKGEKGDPNSEVDATTKKNKDAREAKIKSICAQNEDLRHIAQTLTLELERARNIEKNLRADNARLQREQEGTALELSGLQARQAVLERALQDAKDSYEKLKAELALLRRDADSYGQEGDKAADKEAMEGLREALRTAHAREADARDALARHERDAAQMDALRAENRRLQHEERERDKAQAYGLLRAEEDSTEIAQRFEEVKNSYDERIRVLQQDFEARRLQMAAEIQRLRAAMADQERDLRAQHEAADRVAREQHRSEVELLTAQYRALLEEKGKLTFEMCSLRAHERPPEDDPLRAQSDRQHACAEAHELRFKLQETKASYENLVRNLQRDFEAREAATKREVEQLQRALAETEVDLQGRLLRKEKDAQQRFSKRLEALTEENLALTREKELVRSEVEALKNQENKLLRSLEELERNMDKVQIENESLKRDQGAKQRYMDEIVRLNVERQEKIKELEETRSRYEARISSILGDFEARRLVMVNEMEKLRGAVENKDAELRQRGEKERQEKERVGKYAESLSAELRRQLQEKEQVMAEMGTLRSQEQILAAALKDAQQAAQKASSERDALQRELLGARQQAQQAATAAQQAQASAAAARSDEDEALRRCDRLRADFETRRLVMVNEMEKLRAALATQSDDHRRQLDDREAQTKSKYERLVECLSEELKHALADAKRSEDLLRDQWSAKMAECREQARRQLEAANRSAALRAGQLAGERDDLQARLQALEAELQALQRRRRQAELELVERDKRAERLLQQLERLKESVLHKDNMIDVLQETVRKECTEREDILRKLDDIRRASKSPLASASPSPSQTQSPSPDALLLDKACAQYVASVRAGASQSPSASPSPQPPPAPPPTRQAPSPLPLYLKGVPLVLPPSCLPPAPPPSKGGTPVRFPSTPRLAAGAAGAGAGPGAAGEGPRAADLARLCVVGRDLEFTVGAGAGVARAGKGRRSGKLARSRSLQSPTSHA